MTFTATDGVLDGHAGPIVIAPPVFVRDGETFYTAKARTVGTVEHLAAALNAAQALLDKLYDNPTLFFGMEDTCQDECDDLRDALAKLA